MPNVKRHRAPSNTVRLLWCSQITVVRNKKGLALCFLHLLVQYLPLQDSQWGGIKRHHLSTTPLSLAVDCKVSNEPAHWYFANWIFVLCGVNETNCVFVHFWKFKETSKFHLSVQAVVNSDWLHPQMSAQVKVQQIQTVCAPQMSVQSHHNTPHTQ